ncbi:MAG: bifunctional nuclease family protein [Phycisphaerales bacterium]|nr:bifunctional nuclease family protein [Phycisphaerales bacterium]
MLVKMTLARIVIVDSEDEKMSMIVLREVEGDRAFPILIGVNEAYAIDRRLKGIVVQRPLTHDLVERMLEQLDCHLERIVISELRDSTFYAKLVLRRNGDLLEVDSRPSDAIAIGAGTPAPIFVDDAVLRDVC